MLKFKYYHYRDAMNRPMITMCVIYNEDNEPLAFGNAICSLHDNPEKKMGRALARDRAVSLLADYSENASAYCVHFDGPYYAQTIDTIIPHRAYEASYFDLLEYKAYVFL